MHRKFLKKIKFVVSTKRFDRTDTGARIHYTSTMAILGYVDGKNFHDRIKRVKAIYLLYKSHQ